MKREVAKREIDFLDHYLSSACQDYGEREHEAMMMAVKLLEQEPCEDAVRRTEVIDELNRLGRNAFKNDTDYDNFFAFVDSLPAVTPQTPRWIPVSERLPKDRNWYLGIFKESDTGWINPLPFICDYVGSETKATTKEYWILRGFTDIDEPCDYYLGLECVAWQPLPKPYKESEGSEGEDEDRN